jgi:uncharacterized alkaline shock family protein YloU
MCTASTGISDVFSRNKNITKGVKVEVGTEEVSVDLYLNVEYGTPIQTAATNVQESVRKSIETMTGLHVVRVDVHVQGLSFEKEKKENLVGLESFEGQVSDKKETVPAKEEKIPVAQEDVKPEPVVSFVEEVAAEAEDVVSEEAEAAEAVEEPVQNEGLETEQENQAEE